MTVIAGPLIGVSDAANPKVSASSIQPPVVLPRDEWAASRDPTGPLAVEEVTFLLVHHTASRNDYTPDDVPGLLRGFFDFHTTGRGWHDIAYNFLIDRFGRVWEGRQGSIDGPVAGDATGGNQGFSQLCALIGDFTSESPTPEALDSLVSVLAWMADRYGVETAPGSTVTFVSRGSNRWPVGAAVESATIAGHRDMSQTECPGDVLYEYVTSRLIADVTAHRAPPITEAIVTTTGVTATSTTTLAPSSTSAAPSSTVVAPESTLAFLAADDPDVPGDNTFPLDIGRIGIGAALTASLFAVTTLLSLKMRRKNDQ
jgi:hypothetical protein